MTGGHWRTRQAEAESCPRVCALVGRWHCRARSDGVRHHSRRATGTRRAGGFGAGGARPAGAGRRHLPRRQPRAARRSSRSGRPTRCRSRPAQHLVEIRTAGAAKTETPLLAQNVTVPAGFEGSLIAHLGADGNPTLTAYADDLTPVPAGQTRVVVRHTRRRRRRQSSCSTTSRRSPRCRRTPRAPTSWPPVTTRSR